jgi:hypothetical protein
MDARFRSDVDVSRRSVGLSERFLVFISTVRFGSVDRGYWTV